MHETLPGRCLNAGCRFSGTVSYCAPELLKEGKLTKAADVFSFAMLMWEIYFGTPLFQGLSTPQASTFPRLLALADIQWGAFQMLFSGRCNKSGNIKTDLCSFCHLPASR